MTTWEYSTVPLLTHATKQILDTWGADGWELVAVMPGPTGEQHIAYMKRPTTGKVGAGVSAEDATSYARQAALNALAAINSLVDIDSVSIVKVTGFVASAPGFGGQPGVINGASDLFGDVFGTAHARSAVGVSDLPLDAPVEVEVIARRSTGAE